MYPLVPQDDADRGGGCEGVPVWGSGTSRLVAAVAATGSTALWLGVALVHAPRQHREALDDRGWLLERERESAARAAVDAVDHYLRVEVLNTGPSVLSGSGRPTLDHP
jgi:hypothetical protein